LGENLRNTVVPGKASHGGHFFLPGMEGVTEGHEGRKPGCLEFGNGAQKAWGQLAALSLGEVFVQQQVTEPLFEPVDRLQSRPFPQINRKSLMLIGAQIVAVPAHHGD
jgi:hypothetical protein